jgi:DNA-binding NtrC family response regulator
VDDEESIRDLGEQILTDSGYAVLTAPDGESALRFYQQKKDEIDLIILDLIMPGIGGRRCLNDLLKVNPEVNILVSSGYYLDDRTREVIKAGAKGFVSKPYDLTQMLDVVRQVLDEASDKTRVEIHPSMGSSYSQDL